MKGEIRFTSEDVDRAREEWPCNCGPGALCAVLGKTPAEIRPHLLDVEKKGYTNPTLMFGVLEAMRVPHQVLYRGDNEPGLKPVWPSFGLVRVQWGGPWTREGVPMRVRYRKTHWIAVRNADNGGREVFDINAVDGGWHSFDSWSHDIVPWILNECVPEADGTWWPTHCIQIDWPTYRNEYPRIHSAINAAHIISNDEAQMQAQLEKVFIHAGLTFEREKRLSDGERLDFWFPESGLALEVKMRTSVNQVIRQLKRYADLPEVQTVVLVARTPVILPRSLSGKPVHGIFTWRQLIA